MEKDVPKKGFLSRTKTLPPAWSTLCAALNPDNPPPTIPELELLESRTYHTNNNFYHALNKGKLRQCRNWDQSEKTKRSRYRQFRDPLFEQAVIVRAITSRNYVVTYKADTSVDACIPEFIPAGVQFQSRNPRYLITIPETISAQEWLSAIKGAQDQCAIWMSGMDIRRSAPYSD